jgi:activator of HSP90 ATPase
MHLLALNVTLLHCRSSAAVVHCALHGPARGRLRPLSASALPPQRLCACCRRRYDIGAASRVQLGSGSDSSKQFFNGRHGDHVQCLSERLSDCVMAKFDEADPRWIVRDREDGTNVNGWHWEEKDLLPRFQTALNEQLLGHTLFENDVGKVSIKKIDSCTGEFSGNQRKGKRFVVYEFEIKFEFEATLVAGGTSTGKYVFPSVDSVDGLGSLEVNFRPESEKSDQKDANAFAKAHGIPAIRKILVESVKFFESQFIGASAGGTPMAAAAAAQPTASVATAAAGGGSAAVPTPASAPAPAPAAEVPRKSGSSRAGDLTLSCDFTARCEDMYVIPPHPSPPAFSFHRCSCLCSFLCFTESGRVSAYTQSAAVISAEPASQFNLMNGSITGEMLTVIKNEKIVQKWRLKHWPADVYSTVTIMLFQVDSSTCRCAFIMCT